MRIMEIEGNNQMTTADRVNHFTKTRIEIERLITRAAELVAELNTAGHVAYFHYETKDNDGELNFHAQYRNPDTETPAPSWQNGEKIVLQPSDYPQPPEGPPGGEDE